MKDQTHEWREYFFEVALIAKELGYTPSQIGMFISNIHEYFNDGKSVEECVEEVF